MRKMFVVVPLVGLLIAAIWFAVEEWLAVDFSGVPAWGFVAMGFGILFSLAIGIGLMALVFYSSRHGYDEAAGGERPGSRDSNSGGI